MNEAYNKYKDDIVFIVATITPLDTYEKISGLYVQNSGVANDFPLVTFTGKGRDLATLLGFPAGGQVHIIHPTREFERGIGDTPYKQPYLNNAIQAALDDDCDHGDTTYELVVNNGSGDGKHEEGESITITADAAPDGKVFDKWTGDTDYLADANSETTTVTMPAKKITVSATYKDDESGETYTLVVNGGSGDGDHKEGASITITADDAPDGKVFDKWTGDTDYLADANSATTTVTMPSQKVTVTATYKDKGPIVKKDNYMTISSWDAATGEQGSTITIDSSKKADTVLTVQFDLAQSDSKEEKWAWAQISGYANSDFSEVSSVELTYAASEPVNIVLDQEGLADKGESYRYLLPAQDLGSVKINIDDFKQPSYITGDAQTDLDLSKVLSVSFSATKENATTNLELQGIFLEGFKETAILSHSAKSTQQLSVTAFTGKKLQLSQVPANEYTVEIFNLAGKKLYKTSTALKGNCSLSMQSINLTSGVYILKIKSASLSMVVKRSVL